ncbi:glycosyltransferase family 2 protein [Candidatus Sumerlaeota bacterium]|nr:glycosyltransferase family 2 protein [Candidatus Sumerlaeota bacterium]
MHPSPDSQRSPSATVLIPNWNGEDFIVRCVSSALMAAREHRAATGEAVEILVVDDASTDRSLDRLERDCPAARLIRREQNGGFAVAVNQGAREARGDALVLINSDMALPPDFLIHLLAPLADPGVFAVTAKTVNWTDGEPNHVNMTARLVRGQITLEHSDPTGACDTLFLQGGAAAVRRDVFLAAGGFSPLYHPGYWEDYDLSLRAIQAGWRIVYEPRALARHLGKASLTARHGSGALRRLTERNRLLFTWSLMSDARWRHWLGLPGWVAREIRRGGATRLRALLAALRMLPAVASQRRGFPPPRALGDREALARTRPPAGTAVHTVPGED